MIFSPAHLLLVLFSLYSRQSSKQDMGVVYDKAFDGTRTAADLDGRSNEINLTHEKSKLTPLAAAVLGGHLNQIKLLLEKGAFVDGEEKLKEFRQSRPPLWVAAAKNPEHAYEVVQILLDNRADPSIRSPLSDKTSPAFAAVKTRKSPSLTRVLVDAGASDLDDARQLADSRTDR